MLSNQGNANQNDINKSKLPPRARSINELLHAKLNIPLELENLPKITLVKKRKDIEKQCGESFQNNEEDVQEQPSSQKTYHFKKHAECSDSAELEAYNAGICEYLATERYVPSVHSYFDEYEKIVGVVSQTIPEFVSNQDDPLQQEDLHLNNRIINIEWQEKELRKQLKQAIIYLDKDPTIASHSRYIAQNVYHTFFNVTNTAYSMRQFLIQLKEETSPYSIVTLNKLINFIKTRKQAIKHNLPLFNNATEELQFLKKFKKVAQYLNELYLSSEDRKITIAELDAFDRDLFNVDLTNSDEINLEIENEIKTIPVKELKKYQILKGLTISLITRLLYKEGDLNNSNLSKYGFLIDFDWTKADILYLFKNNDFFIRYFRKPTVNSFACHPNNIENFPDIETDLCYWPTKQMDLYKIVTDIIAEFLDDCGNLRIKNENDIHRRLAHFVLLAFNTCSIQPHSQKGFINHLTDFVYKITLKIKAIWLGLPVQELTDKETIQGIFGDFKQQLKYFIDHHQILITHYEENIIRQYGNEKNIFSKRDNEIYKSLSTHPVVIFHKYKTLLKYILTDISVYRSLANLNISQQQLFIKNGEIKILRHVLVEDEELRQKECWASLIIMPAFVEFINQHGKLVLTLIKEECVAYRNKYESKVSEKPYYQDLVNSIDLKKMENKYHDLLRDLSILKVNQHTHSQPFFELSI